MHHGCTFSPNALGRDEGADVEEAVRLAARCGVGRGEVRPHRLRRVERNRQREEEAARGGGKRRARRGEMLVDEIVDRPLAVGERGRDVHAKLARAIAAIRSAARSTNPVM